MRLYNNGRLYVKKYNLSVQFLLTSALFAQAKNKPSAPDGTGHPLPPVGGILHIGAKKAAAYTYYIMWRASISSTSEAMASQPLERRS